MKSSFLRKGITLLVFVLGCCAVNTIQGQISGWIYFKNKEVSNWKPEDVFTKEALLRRALLGIQFSFEDQPVSDNYVKEIKHLADSLHGYSKWLNAAVIKCSKKNWIQISRLPFVSKIDTSAYSTQETQLCEIEIQEDSLNSDKITSIEQSVENLQGSLFRDHHISGRNVIVAILDAGFKGVNSGAAFEHIRNEQRIIATKDFIHPRSKSIYAFSTHGSRVLSCVAGKMDSVSFGLGTGAKFILARVTPQFGGLRSLNDIQWIQALEWADEQGASLVNSSLSFTTQLFSRGEMDGVSARISRVASHAAERGIVIVNSAGNEFDGAWEIIGAPADATDILSIGSISPFNFLHSEFSSIGPTADGRMKPDLCAIGELYVADEKIEFANGTSFAAPLVAGFVACIQEMHPDWDAYKVMDEMRKSGHLYPYYDYAHGFGVPQASYFFNQITPDTSLAFIKSKFSHCELYQIDSLHSEISFCFHDDSLVQLELENLQLGMDKSMNQQANVFISVLNEQGELKSFGFDRIHNEMRFGNDSYFGIEEAPIGSNYFFGLLNLAIPTCNSCTLRIHFLNEIINLPMSHE